MKPILDIRHMSVFFTQYDRGMRRRRLPVIRDLTLTVEPGQIVAVVGASGSGKSLLAHAVLGLLPGNSHLEGEILRRRWSGAGQCWSGTGWDGTAPGCTPLNCPAAWPEGSSLQPPCWMSPV